MILILALHVACGVAASARDVALPFSMSRATADYIKANHLENMLIIGDQDCLVSPITGYLDRDMYYPKQQAFGSYTIYNQKRMHTVTEPELLSCAEKWKSARHQDIMLVLCYPLTDSECRAHNIRFLKHFGGSIDRFESYWLYIMSARKETEH